MANEIVVNRTTGLTLYFVIWRASDMYVYNTASVASDPNDKFEDVGTWNNTRAGQCDISLTEKSVTGWYQGNFPVLSAGLYYIRVYEKSGSNPDITDLSMGGIDVIWNGSLVITNYNLITKDYFDANVPVNFTSLDIDDNGLVSIETPVNFTSLSIDSSGCVDVGKIEGRDATEAIDIQVSSTVEAPDNFPSLSITENGNVYATLRHNRNRVANLTPL
jgi:hypothetical protein